MRRGGSLLRRRMWWLAVDRLYGCVFSCSQRLRRAGVEKRHGACSAAKNAREALGAAATLGRLWLSLFATAVAQHIPPDRWACRFCRCSAWRSVWACGGLATYYPLPLPQNNGRTRFCEQAAVMTWCLLRGHGCYRSVPSLRTVVGGRISSGRAAHLRRELGLRQKLDAAVVVSGGVVLLFSKRRLERRGRLHNAQEEGGRCRSSAGTWVAPPATTTSFSACYMPSLPPLSLPCKLPLWKSLRLFLYPSLCCLRLRKERREVCPTFFFTRLPLLSSWPSAPF